MYEELVKVLQKHYAEHCPLDGGSGICGGVLAGEAANAIEELSAKVDRLQSFADNKEHGNVNNKTTCKCYHADKNFLGSIGVCWGTKECEACSCGGDGSKCDFYDYVRERAKIITGLRNIVLNYKGRLTPYMRETIMKAVVALEDQQKPFNATSTAPLAYHFCPHCGEKIR